MHSLASTIALPTKRFLRFADRAATSAHCCERCRLFAKFALSRRAANASELHGLQNVVLQQMEQDIMAQTNIAAENRSDQAVAARQTPKDLRSSARPSPQSRPPVANDGLETVRSNDC
jgi:hypothetical protein